MYTLAYKPNLPFLISDTRALSPGRQSARMSKIKNGKLGFYGAKQPEKCGNEMVKAETTVNPDQGAQTVTFDQ